MEKSMSTEGRGPVTPPDPDINQNGINEDDDEMDLAAQQAMQTPSPVNEEYELMEQNNAIANEINSNFDDFIEDRSAEKPLTPPVNEPEEKSEILEDVKMSDEGELEDGSPNHQEKKLKKKKHRDRAPSEGDDKSGRKRRHSRSSNEEKKKLEKLKEMKFGSAKSSGQDTRRFNFRETTNTPEKKKVEVFDKRILTPTKTPVKERRASPDPLDYYRSDKPHPLLKKLRELKTQSLALALDTVFTITPQDIAVLGKSEMIEVLDIMFDLNRRREQLTANRMILTNEVRMICNTELTILNDLEHLMNHEERGFFHHLKQCPSSMDELVPFDPKIAPTDVDLSKGTTRLHAVDLLPPPETPLIGRHDQNWDTFIKHIPPQFRGCPPPPSVLHEFKPYITPIKPNLAQPPPNFPSNTSIPLQTLTNVPPPSQPQSLASISTVPPQSNAIQQQNSNSLAPNNQQIIVTSQPPPLIQTSQQSLIQTNVPPPQFSQNNISQPPPQMIVSQAPSSGPLPLFSQPPPISSQQPPQIHHHQQPIMDQSPLNEIQSQFLQKPPPNQASFHQPVETLPMNEIIAVSSAPFIPQQKPMEPILNTGQPPPNVIASIAPNQQKQNPITSAPPPITSVPPPNRSLDITSFPPPTSNQQQFAPSQQPTSSLASLDLSVPPPIFSGNIAPMEHQKQLSPISAFRNSLKPSLLNSLSGSSSQKQRSTNDPMFTPPSASMAFLHQPPPSIKSSSASPQRFISSIPTLNSQSPQPLMSFEAKAPYQTQQPPQHHGKSPSTSFRPSKGNSGSVKKPQRRGGRAMKSSSQGSPSKLSERANASPASSINSTAATVGSSRIDNSEMNSSSQ